MQGSGPIPKVWRHDPYGQGFLDSTPSSENQTATQSDRSRNRERAEDDTDRRPPNTTTDWFFRDGSGAAVSSATIPHSLYFVNHHQQHYNQFIAQAGNAHLYQDFCQFSSHELVRME